MFCPVMWELKGSRDISHCHTSSLCCSHIADVLSMDAFCMLAWSPTVDQYIILLKISDNNLALLTSTLATSIARQPQWNFIMIVAKFLCFWQKKPSMLLLSLSNMFIVYSYFHNNDCTIYRNIVPEVVNGYYRDGSLTASIISAIQWYLFYWQAVSLPFPHFM